MYLTYTDEQSALRDELRAYFANLMTPARIESLSKGELDGPAYKEIVRQLGQDGWLGLAWPQEYGGQGLGPIEQVTVNQEIGRVGVPGVLDVIGIGMLGPAIIAHGTDEQKSRYLGPMLHGDEVWCQLFSEPGAGSDLASLSTRAVRDGDEWVIHGQKVWTTQAHEADYIFLQPAPTPTPPSTRVSPTCSCL